jgi:hypothetical protein
MSRILVGGQPVYVHGANYPWMVKNRKSNYGLDFGVNRWGTHEGVSTNLMQVERDFAEMQSLGFNTLRWFAFTDGRGGIVFDADGLPVSLAEKTLYDVDCALTIAQAHGLRIIFVLMDFLWMHDLPQPENPDKFTFAHVLRTQQGQRALVENVFVPLLHRFGNHDNIFAWEVMNEPDWVVRGLDPNKSNVSKPLPLDEFKKFVALVADAVHSSTSHYVTVGGGRIKYMHVWDDNELKLDFLQVHTYNDFLTQKWDGRLYGKHYSQLNLSRPLLIGEFSTNRNSEFDRTKKYRDISLIEYLNFAKSQGYAGSLFWSFNGVDKCGTESREILKQWHAAETVT